MLFEGLFKLRSLLLEDVNLDDCVKHLFATGALGAIFDLDLKADCLEIEQEITWILSILLCSNEETIFDLFYKRDYIKRFIECSLSSDKSIQENVFPCLIYRLSMDWLITWQIQKFVGIEL